MAFPSALNAASAEEMSSSLNLKYCSIYQEYVKKNKLGLWDINFALLRRKHGDLITFHLEIFEAFVLFLSQFCCNSNVYLGSEIVSLLPGARRLRDRLRAFRWGNGLLPNTLVHLTESKANVLHSRSETLGIISWTCPLVKNRWYVFTRNPSINFLKNISYKRGNHIIF